MAIENTIQQALADHPEIRTVLEIANRTRDLEAKEQPREIAIATEILGIPTTSQCPV